MITKEELKNYKNKMEDLTMRRTPDGQKIYGIEELAKMARAENAHLRYITYLGDQSLELIRASLPDDCYISTPDEFGMCRVNRVGKCIGETIGFGHTVVIDVFNKKVALLAGEQLIYILGERQQLASDEAIDKITKVLRGE